ncbi:MAG TPA: multidrug efflux SMR transporter [Conexibacter sp.]|jgi:small multidrug resistance pump|nr:multidrug efflux SMR transporter [Conexibacter sp.]
MAYAFLFAAIASEIATTICLKYTDGFTRLAPSLVVVVGYAITFGLFAQALRSIPVSVAYAIWSALGTAAIAAIGFTFLGEPASAATVAGIVLIVAGVVVVHLGGAG